LLDLLQEAYRVCRELYDLTLNRLGVLNGDSDEAIIAFIDSREVLINKLVALEYRVYMIFDNYDAYENGRLLPGEIEAERLKTRRLVNAITELDLEVIKLLSVKVQAYKDKTLKIRNRKHISAYLKGKYGRF